MYQDFEKNEGVQNMSGEVAQNESFPQYVAYSASSYSPPPAPAKPKKGKKIAGFIALALCFSLLGSILGAGGVLLVSSRFEQQNSSGSQATAGQADNGNFSAVLKGQRENSVIQTVDIDTSKEMTPAEVYAANVNSTVGITTSITTNYWGFQSTSAASGSGFIVSEDGYILTNYHVVQGSNSITVSLYDGTTYDAVLVGYDESNDIAVLKVDTDGLIPVIIGDSDNINVGDSVVAIGNPLGELTFSLTVGAVSAKDREVTLSSTVTMDLIQTDCAINSGNSGGALFNLYGEVIGITNAKYSSSSSSEASIDNIGFAIPLNDVWNIIESIIENGYISKPYIGISVYDVSAETQSFGIPKGAAVDSVTAGSPAEKAGLQKGDVITIADGREITGSSDIVDYISECEAGDRVDLTVYRQGELIKINVVIEEQIQSATENDSQQQSAEQQLPSNPWGGGTPGYWY